MKKATISIVLMISLLFHAFGDEDEIMPYVHSISSEDVDLLFKVMRESQNSQNRFDPRDSPVDVFIYYSRYTSMANYGTGLLHTPPTATSRSQLRV